GARSIRVDSVYAVSRTSDCAAISSVLSKVVCTRSLALLEVGVASARNERLRIHLETQRRSECPLDSSIHRERCLMNVSKYITSSERAFRERICNTSHELPCLSAAAPVRLEANAQRCRRTPIEIQISTRRHSA